MTRPFHLSTTQNAMGRTGTSNTFIITRFYIACLIC
nr:MAG TPA: hypothetical protein [Caudoviricetes sp.]